MIRLPALLLALAACGGAQAQQRPYEPLIATYDRAPEDDPELKALIETLHRAVADRNFELIDASLSKDVAALECETDPTRACQPGLKALTRSDAKLPPPLRLRQALCCRDILPARISRALRDQTLLGVVGSALEEESVGAHPALPGLACLPAWPRFDAAKAAAIAAAADIERENLRVATRELVLRGTPSAGAAEVARIAPGQMAPLVTDLPDSIPDGWTAIALPQGGIGYTDMLGLTDLAPAGLCFARDAAGKWSIALAVQRRS